MKKAVVLEFSELQEMIEIELDDSQLPRAFSKIIESLPIKVTINRWGDELYTDETPVKAEEDDAESVVSLLDVAYWSEGSAICFFYGPTPISKQNKIIPYSPVNVVGRIKNMPADVKKFLASVEKLHINKNVPVELR
jgi:hypothetical protein